MFAKRRGKGGMAVLRTRTGVAPGRRAARGSTDPRPTIHGWKVEGAQVTRSRSRHVSAAPVQQGDFMTAHAMPKIKSTLPVGSTFGLDIIALEAFGREVSPKDAYPVNIGLNRLIRTVLLVTERIRREFNAFGGPMPMAIVYGAVPAGWSDPHLSALAQLLVWALLADDPNVEFDFMVPPHLGVMVCIREANLAFRLGLGRSRRMPNARTAIFEALRHRVDRVHEPGGNIPQVGPWEARAGEAFPNQLVRSVLGLELDVLDGLVSERSASASIHPELRGRIGLAHLMRRALQTAAAEIGGTHDGLELEDYGPVDPRAMPIVELLTDAVLYEGRSRAGYFRHG